MNTRGLRSFRPKCGALAAALLATLVGCSGSFCVGSDECGWGAGPPQLALSGTAATGAALASASVAITCADGAAGAVSDGGGHYGATFDAWLPCVLTVTSGSVTLHSAAFAGGIFNTTPETELMLVYLAAQLSTTVAGLVAGLPSNALFQQVLGNPNYVLAAQSAVVFNLQQHYALTLSTPAFLTTPFVVGQPGVDSDLEALAAAGAIDANGMPDAAAVSLLSAAGQAQPIARASAR
ncbi:hypothetical protein WKR88_02790 [Trinickia caryophylli]|uniref:Lipoprotein n=1 Tax=Trinickia caryophylli TaxID=28094 RepID=A0A1X7FTN1_TRICW|nr:hypothetical protein [Trinickia caryophylli]PMS11891.1 hypothetical protein C0Z17_11845 [Trinickia caryophylli]TRX14032.1 hypothetical protein FNF07_22060 [Trinickia caryophylli]WQE15629.1 hypothetical protein U0034_24270 [Trinickia caryophylli]SMF58614.1 hypothetical protein SAMN06295900_111126 [Trinickia caryophylli]GLU33607.1 hypothetical protein Busp01_34490 [Trinickia caryophylli]